MSRSMFDVVVVGAGISGIAAARFYLFIHPQCRLVILEKDTHLGGVWNSRRLYQHFWTQWTVGTAEYSDRPMPVPPTEDTYFDTFKAKYTTQYLEDYVDQKIYAGQSLRERIQFRTEVQNIKKVDGHWVIIASDSTSTVKTYHASKLIMASGITSVPNLPNLPNNEEFEGPIIHQGDFGQSSVLSSSDMKNVTVLGGSKSSADMVYASVKAGKCVTWIIRARGTGPGFFLAAKGVGPYKNAYEIGSTRIASTLSPNFFDDTWWTRFLHTTSWGVKLASGFWKAVNEDMNKGADYERPGTKGFEKLKPHVGIFWQNGTGGLINRPDFWETIAPNVQVYLDDIDSFDKHTIRLKSGEEVPSDALLLGTGWVPSLNFFDQTLLAELGLPHLPKDEETESGEKWARLEKAADQKVIEKFPLLASPPTDYFKKPNPNTPYRLYKSMAPLSDASDRSIVVIGHVLVANYFRVAEVQSIWATAYLDGKLELPNADEMEKEVALFTAWCKRRYLSNGEKGNHMVFEMQGYTDKLLEQLGIKSHRRGWFWHYFAPGTMSDLRGVGEEYVMKFGADLPKGDGGRRYRWVKRRCCDRMMWHGREIQARQINPSTEGMTEHLASFHFTCYRR